MFCWNKNEVNFSDLSVKILKRAKKQYYRINKVLTAERRLIDKYFVDNKKRVLDIGCGSGRISLFLLNKGFNVTGIDINSVAIEEFKKSITPNVCNNVNIILGDFNDFFLEEESFDYIISLGVLNCVMSDVRRKIFLDKIVKILKKDGIVILSVFMNINLIYFFAICILFFPFKLTFNIFNFLLNKNFQYFSFVCFNDEFLARSKNLFEMIKMELRNFVNTIRYFLTQLKFFLSFSEVKMHYGEFFCFFNKKSLVKELIESGFKIINIFSYRELIYNKKSLFGRYIDQTFYLVLTK